MMVGALLTKCGCEVCTSSIPELPESFTKLVKGFTATTQFLYENKDGLGNTGPVPTKIVFIAGNGWRCHNNPIMEYGATGPFKWDPTFLNWNPPITSGIDDYFLIYGIYSNTQGSVSWNIGASSLESTTGGYARTGTNTILVTGGIPIKRYVYQFNLRPAGATGTNNEPEFRYETFEEPRDCCCGCTVDPLCSSCPTITYGSVTGGAFVNRTITSGKFNASEYGTLYLKYPGLINGTYNAFTINLANNPTNNAKTWQAIVFGGNVTLQSSVGDVAGPYSGSLTSIISNLSTHTTWFSSVTLNSNFTLSGATTTAQGTDLPNWTSLPVQRGVNGTSISVPIVFAGYPSAPSTYQCGFYSVSGNPFFATNFSSYVGTFSYDENVNGYQAYLESVRYPKKSSFVTNNEFRGFYYTDEYDSWLQTSAADLAGSSWSISSGSSTHTTSYTIPGLTSYSEEYTLKFNECYEVGDPPDPEFGDQLCDNTDTNGPALDCPSDSAWFGAYNYFTSLPGSLGLINCDGGNECECLPPGPGPAPQTDCCVCGSGTTSESQFLTETKTMTQTLSGSWYLA